MQFLWLCKVSRPGKVMSGRLPRRLLRLHGGSLRETQFPRSVPPPLRVGSLRPVSGHHQDHYLITEDPILTAAAILQQTGGNGGKWARDDSFLDTMDCRAMVSKENEDLRAKEMHDERLLHSHKAQESDDQLLMVMQRHADSAAPGGGVGAPGGATKYLSGWASGSAKRAD